MIVLPEILVATELDRRVEAAAAFALRPTEPRSRTKWRWRRYVWQTHGRTAHA